MAAADIGVAVEAIGRLVGELPTSRFGQADCLNLMLYDRTSIVGLERCSIAWSKIRLCR